MIPGVKIEMGGREFVVPPLTLGKLKRFNSKVKEMPSDVGEQIDILVEIVLAGLQRNYPDATTEMVEELLDLENAQRVVKMILTNSGSRPIEPGETEAGRSNGATSTLSSPQPADIPIQ